MKKTIYFISLAMAALFVSCSGTTDDASISFSVPREIVSSVFKSSDSSAQSDYAVKKIKCTLLDKNEKEIDSQTDDIAENTNTVITFSGIPAGTKVSASATIYGSDNENSTEYSLYAGQSGKITVKPGNNTITLKLKKTTTTVVLYNNTSDTTVSSLSYATLTSSGLSTPKELLANTNEADAGNSTEIVDYCFDTSNNLYAIVKQTASQSITYSIKKYPYSNNAYGTETTYACDDRTVNSVNYIEAADNDTLYAGVSTDSGAKIAKITFTAPNETSENGIATFTPYDLSIYWSNGEYYSIHTFCTDTDGTNFYIITGIDGTCELASYTVKEGTLTKGNSITLVSYSDENGYSSDIFSTIPTDNLPILVYSDICYINDTLYLLVKELNGPSTTALYSRGALCTFAVSETSITPGTIGIGYQTTEGSISYTGDYNQTSNSNPTVTQTSYLGDGKTTFYGPVKFIARKEDELVIADEGYSVTEEPYKSNSSHTQGTVSSKNAVVTFDLNKQSLNFTSLDGEYFDKVYSGYFYGSSFHK